MKPIPISHQEYQYFVVEQLQKYYTGDVLVLVKNDWPIISKLWITDLSFLTSWLHHSYSNKGPIPRDPASMMRSYLLLLLTHPTMSISKWVDTLYRTPLYAILSGFEPLHVPGIGTFYDFFQRLWGKEKPNVKPALKPQRKKQKKKKPKKGEKASPPKSGFIKKFINRFFRYGSKRKELPEDRLFELFQSHFLKISAELGLLGKLDALGVIGDGTPIETCRYIRSKPTCDCGAQGLENCHHSREYSQPDINTGWDSSREKYFNGYHLYMLSASDSPYDLPLYPRLQPASRHDGISLVTSAIEFSQRSTLGTIDKMLLDSAHDIEAIYELMDHFQIEPFIDLKKRTKKNMSTESDIQISPEGVPICSQGLEMKPSGFDHTRNRQKWKCSLACGTKNTCSNPCSNAKYGRNFHTFPKDNLRLFTKTPRESKKWKLIYKRRTSIERSNKREKIDFHLESGHHRTTKLWYIRIYAIMMCQHIDSWYSVQKDKLHLENIILNKPV